MVPAPTAQEIEVNDTVGVTIPFDPDGVHLRDLLAEAIAAAKQEARANGLTDADIDAELADWRAEPRG
jgi:hypothetical protein